MCSYVNNNRKPSFYVIKHCTNGKLYKQSRITFSYMAIKEEVLLEILKEPNADIEKTATISSDGKNLLIRVPKNIVTFLNLKKGDKLRWLVKSANKEIKMEVVKKS